MHDDFCHLNTGPFSVPNMVSQLDFPIHPGWPGLKKGQIPNFVATVMHLQIVWKQRTRLHIQ